MLLVEDLTESSGESPVPPGANGAGEMTASNGVAGFPTPDRSRAGAAHRRSFLCP